MTMQELVLLGIKASILGTVFSFGLQAKVTDVLGLARQPSLLLRSFASLFVVMPAAALLIVGSFNLPPPTSIVLLALAISPIPPLLPKKIGKAGGTANYGLGLMVLTGIVSVLLVPLLLSLLGRALDRPLAMSSFALAKVMLTMIVAPLALGMLIHARFPEIAARLAKPVLRVSTVLLLLGATVLIAAMMPRMRTLTGNGTLWGIVTFIAVGLLSGHVLGGPVEEERSVLALSSASRHPAIALAISQANFPNQKYLAATIVLYLLIATLIVVPYVRWRRRVANR